MKKIVKSDNSGTDVSDKLQELPGIIDIFNRNTSRFLNQKYGEKLILTALLNLRIHSHPPPIRCLFRSKKIYEVEEQLITTANDLDSENPNNDAVVILWRFRALNRSAH